MSTIRLNKAQIIIRKAFEHAATLGLKPLAVAVLDAGGHLKAYQAQDGTTFFRPQIAHGKAYGALALGRSSRGIGQMAAERPHFIAALNTLAGGAIVPVPGGVLVRDKACAIAGIEAAGFEADVT